MFQISFDLRVREGEKDARLYGTVLVFKDLLRSMRKRFRKSKTNGLRRGVIISMTTPMSHPSWETGSSDVKFS